MGSKKADNASKNVVFVFAGRVYTLIQVANFKPLGDWHSKVQGIHVRHLIAYPGNVQHKNLRQRFINNLSLHAFLKLTIGVWDSTWFNFFGVCLTE